MAGTLSETLAGVDVRRPYTRLPNGTIVDTQWKRKREQYRRAADTLHQLGLAHRWNSESARKAALTMWEKKKKGASGRRLGYPVKRQDRIDHALMREYYSNIRGTFGDGTIYYEPGIGQWLAVMSIGRKYFNRVISERAALTRLGHLKARKR